MKRSLAILAVFLGLIASAFWGGMQWRSLSGRMMAEHQARWVARYWEDGQSIERVCDRLAREQGVRIFRDQWAAASAPDAALGPVIDGKRICVRRDRLVYWRPAE